MHPPPGQQPPTNPQQPGYPPQGYPPQGYHPQGYHPQGYPPQGYHPQGYPQPPKQGVSAGKVVLFILGAIVMIGIGTWVRTTMVGMGADAVTQEEKERREKAAVDDAVRYIMRRHVR